VSPFPFETEGVEVEIFFYGMGGLFKKLIVTYLSLIPFTKSGAVAVSHIPF